MSQQATPLSSTTSLCPTCLERIPGQYEASADSVYLTRSCPDHGESSRKVWESLDHWEWAGQFGPTNDGTPSDDLTVDGDHACLAVIEITQDCNLSCSYCFASSGPGGTELPNEDVIDLLETVKSQGGTRPIQFSGGEPTVHDDLPALVEQAREMGFGHVEVNTNGLALANRDGYAERLVDAGVTAIYLQFDGVTSDTYEAIREVDILAENLSGKAVMSADGTELGDLYNITMNLESGELNHLLVSPHEQLRHERVDFEFDEMGRLRVPVANVQAVKDYIVVAR